MDVTVRNGRYSAQWKLQCAMEVTVRNGRYSAQWTLQRAETLKGQTFSVHHTIRVCVCVCVCVAKCHVNYAYRPHKHKHIPPTLPHSTLPIPRPTHPTVTKYKIHKKHREEFQLHSNKEK